MATVVNARDVLLQGATRLVPVTVGAGSTWSGTVSGNVTGNVTGTIAGTAAATVRDGAANGTSALSGLSDKISRSATTVTSSGFQQQSSGYASGNGYAYHDAGAIFKYGGVTKLVIDLAGGVFAFKGDITGATGKFYGSVRATTFRLYDDSDNYMAAVTLYAGTSGVELKSMTNAGGGSWSSLGTAFGTYAEIESTNYNEGTFTAGDGVRGVCLGFSATGSILYTLVGNLILGSFNKPTKLTGSAAAPTYRQGIGAEKNISLDGHAHTLSDLTVGSIANFSFSTDGGSTWTPIKLRRDA